MKPHFSRRAYQICLTVTAGGYLLLMAAHVILYALLMEPVPFLNMFCLCALLSALAGIAWKGHIPVLFLGLGVAGIVLFYLSYSALTGLYNLCFLLSGIISLAGGGAGVAIALGGKLTAQRLASPVKALFVVFLALTVFLSAFWGIAWRAQRAGDGLPGSAFWAVPSAYDSTELPPDEAGTLVEFYYNTRAYATDERSVEKRAIVYLPSGYNPEGQYNVLYLLHGTGGDENVWMVKNPYNKTMVDNMIQRGDIAPLIIVMPTWYVDDDCADDPEQLTYTFAEELRQDLIPAFESQYATHAKTVDERGLIDSRDHRALAGLSRGGVTTLHSGLCLNLDLFGWFGVFSGARTTLDYYREHAQSTKFQEYPIHCLYFASGSFDFALEGVVKLQHTLPQIDDRLYQEENCTFDIFPMRRHSMSLWHMALFNFLPQIFEQ